MTHVTQVIDRIVDEYESSGKGMFATAVDPKLASLMKRLQTRIKSSKRPDGSDNIELIVSHVLATLIEVQQYRAESGKGPGRFEEKLLEFVRQAPPPLKATDKAPQREYEIFLFAPIEAYLTDITAKKKHDADALAKITPFEPIVIQRFFEKFKAGLFDEADTVKRGRMMQIIQEICYAEKFSEFERWVNQYIALIEKPKSSAVSTVLNWFKSESPVEDLKQLLEECRGFSLKAKQEASKAKKEAQELEDAFNRIELGDEVIETRLTTVDTSAELRRSTMRPTMRGSLHDAVAEMPSQEHIDAINSLPHNISAAIGEITEPSSAADITAILKSIGRYVSGGSPIDPDNIESITRFVLKRGNPALQENLTERLGTLNSKTSTLQRVSIDNKSFFVDASRANDIQQMIQAASAATKDTLITLLQELAILNAKSLALANNFLEKKQNKYTSSQKLDEYFTVFQNGLKQIDARKKQFVDEALSKLSVDEKARFTQACSGTLFYNYQTDVINNIGVLGSQVLKDTIEKYKAHLEKLAASQASEGSEEAPSLIRPLNDLFIGLLNYVVDSNGEKRSASIAGLLSVINHFLSTDDISDMRKFSLLREIITQKMFNIEDECKAKNTNPNSSVVYSLLKKQLPLLVQSEIEIDAYRVAGSPSTASIEVFANLLEKIEVMKGLSAKGIKFTEEFKSDIEGLPDLIVQKLDVKIRSIVAITNPIQKANALQKALKEIDLIENKKPRVSNLVFLNRLTVLKEVLGEINSSPELEKSIEHHVQEIKSEYIDGLAPVFLKALLKYEANRSGRMIGNASRQDTLTKIKSILDIKPGKHLDTVKLKEEIIKQKEKIAAEYKGWWSPTSSQLYVTLSTMLTQLDTLSVSSLVKPLEVLQGNHPLIEAQVKSIFQSVVQKVDAGSSEISKIAKDNLLLKMDSILKTTASEIESNEPLSFSLESIYQVLKTLQVMHDENPSDEMPYAIISDFLDKIYFYLEKNPFELFFKEDLQTYSADDWSRIRMLATLQKFMDGFDGDRFTDAFINYDLPKIPSSVDHLILSAQNDLVNKFYENTITREEAEQIALSLAQFEGVSKSSKSSFAAILEASTPQTRFAFRLLDFFEKTTQKLPQEDRWLVTQEVSTIKENLLLGSISSDDLLEFLNAIQDLELEAITAEDINALKTIAGQFANGPDADPTAVVSNCIVTALLHPNTDERDLGLLRQAFAELKVLVVNNQVSEALLKKIKDTFKDPQAVERMGALFDQDSQLILLLKSMAATNMSAEATQLVKFLKEVVGGYAMRTETLPKFKAACDEALAPLQAYNEAKASDQLEKAENRAKLKIVSDFSQLIDRAVQSFKAEPSESKLPSLVADLESARDALVDSLAKLGKPGQTFMPLLTEALAAITSAAEDCHASVFKNETFNIHLTEFRENNARHFHSSESEPAHLAKSRYALMQKLSGLKLFEGYAPALTEIMSRSTISKSMKQVEAAIEVATIRLRSPGADVIAIHYILMTALQGVQAKVANLSLNMPLQVHIDKIQTFIDAYKTTRSEFDGSKLGKSEVVAQLDSLSLAAEDNAEARQLLSNRISGLLESFKTTGWVNATKKQGIVNDVTQAVNQACVQLGTGDVVEVTKALTDKLSAIKSAFEAARGSSFSTLPAKLDEMIVNISTFVDLYRSPVEPVSSQAVSTKSLKTPAGIQSTALEMEEDGRRRSWSSSTGVEGFVAPKHTSFNSDATDDVFNQEYEASLQEHDAYVEEPGGPGLGRGRSESDVTVDLGETVPQTVGAEHQDTPISSGRKGPVTTSIDVILAENQDKILAALESVAKFIGRIEGKDYRASAMPTISQKHLCATFAAVDTILTNRADSMKSHEGDNYDSLAIERDKLSKVLSDCGLMIIGGKLEHGLKPENSIPVKAATTASSVQSMQNTRGHQPPSADQGNTPKAWVTLGSIHFSGRSMQSTMARIGAALCIGSLLHKFIGAAVLYFSSAMVPLVVDALRVLRNAYA